MKGEERMVVLRRRRGMAGAEERRLGALQALFAREQELGRLRQGDVNLERIGQIVLDYLHHKREPSHSTPSHSPGPASPNPPSSSASTQPNRNFKHNFSHRTLQMVRKASGSTLLRQNSDSFLAGGNLCSDKSEKKTRKLLRQRAELRRKRREELSSQVQTVPLDASLSGDETRLATELERQMRVLLVSGGSQCVSLAYLSALATLRELYKTRAFATTLEGAVREFVRRNLSERVVAGSEEGELLSQLRARQLSVLLTLASLSESASASLPLCEGSLNWLLDQMGWIMATGDADGARSFLEGTLVDLFVDSVPRHLARLLLELGRRLPIELEHLEEEGEEVEDPVFPSPLKPAASPSTHRSSLLEPHRKRRRDSTFSSHSAHSSHSQPLPSRPNGLHNHSAQSHNQTKNHRHLRPPHMANQKNDRMLKILKIDMAPPGSRARRVRSGTSGMVLKTREVAESPPRKQVPQSELRRRQREMQQKQVERLKIEESPVLSHRLSPRDHASTKSILARKRSLVAEAKNLLIKQRRATAKSRAIATLLNSSASVVNGSPAKVKVRRSRQSLLGLRSSSSSPSPQDESHSVSNSASLSLSSPLPSPLPSPADSPRKSVKRNLQESLLSENTEAVSLLVDEDVVARYRRQVEELRKDKARGKLGEDDIFYGRGLCRKNVFEAEPDGERGVSRDTRQTAAKRLAQGEAKNRSGRAVPRTDVAHTSHFLLNEQNPNPSAPLVPKVILQRLSIRSPNKINKLKLRAISKSSKRRSLTRTTSKTSCGSAEVSKPTTAARTNEEPLSSPTSSHCEDPNDSQLEACLARLSDIPVAVPVPVKVAQPPHLNGVTTEQEKEEERKGRRGSEAEWRRLESLMLSPRSSGGGGGGGGGGGSEWVSEKVGKEWQGRQRSRSASESERRRSRRLCSPQPLLPPSLPSLQSPISPPSNGHCQHDEERSHASWQDEDSLMGVQ